MDWQVLIGSLGFPIVACIALAIYVKYITQGHREDISKLNDLHTQEMMAFKDELKDAIQNNTLVMQKLCDNLSGRDSK